MPRVLIASVGVLLAASNAAAQPCVPQPFAVTRATGAGWLWLHEPASGAFCHETQLNFAPAGVAYSATGTLYVWAQNDGPLVEVDADTGAVIRVAVPENAGGIIQGRDVLLCPNGDVLVAGGSANRVVRFNPTSGAYLGDFVAAGSGGLLRCFGLAWGPNGNLFVTSTDSDEVKEYSGETGAFVRTVVSAGNGGLDQPYDLTFGPDGHMYVSSVSLSGVFKYNGQSGAFLQVLGEGTVPPARGIAFGPRGNLYVATWTGPSGGGVYEVHTGTGALVRQFAPASAAMFFAFPAPSCPADWNDDYVVNSVDLSAFLTSWLSSLINGTLEGDVTGNGTVDSNDISAFIVGWLDAINGGCG